MTSLETLFKDTASVVFCKSHDPFDSTLAYKFTSDIITDPHFIAELKQSFVGVTTTNVPSYPWIGILAELVFFDQRQKPIALVSIVNWECSVSMRPIAHYRMTENGIVVDLDYNLSAYWNSEPFVRSVYEYMKVHKSDDLQKLRDFYLGDGLDLEKLLFHGDASKIGITD